jgi:RNA polymerase sigma-70 factor (ECF subfamily)
MSTQHFMAMRHLSYSVGPPSLVKFPGKRELLPKAKLYVKESSTLLPVVSTSLQKESLLAERKSTSATEMTELEVISRAQAGDMSCFEMLYNRHKRRVFSLCLRMTGNYAEAEDFTQEAFLQLYRKIASFRGESAFSTWLHRLAVNIVLMRFRKKSIPEVSLQEKLESQHEDAPIREFGKNDDSLNGSVDRLTLEWAIRELPPGYRMIFVLHDIEGYEHNEIAEMLGCSTGNSKSQLHKARMKLRSLLPSRQATERPMLVAA